MQTEFQIAEVPTEPVPPIKEWRSLMHKSTRADEKTEPKMDGKSHSGGELELKLSKGNGLW